MEKKQPLLSKIIESRKYLEDMKSKLKNLVDDTDTERSKITMDYKKQGLEEFTEKLSHLLHLDKYVQGKHKFITIMNQMTRDVVIDEEKIFLDIRRALNEK